MAGTIPTAGACLPPPCIVCGSPTPGEDRMTCSRECQWASMRTRPTLTCAGCGGAFVRRRRSAKDAQRYCSRECARRRFPAPIDLTPVSHCAVCGVEFRSRRRRRTCSDPCRVEHIRREARRFGNLKSIRDRAPRPCGRCGEPFTPSYGDKRSVYCSKRCGRRATQPKDGKTDRKRARRAGVVYEPVSRLKVFERDGWRCQCCGTKTPKKLKGTVDDRAPELDHRVPLALGGAHTYENCQLACRRCNSKKGGTKTLGQMPLFARPPNAKRSHGAVRG